MGSRYKNWKRKFSNFIRGKRGKIIITLFLLYLPMSDGEGELEVTMVAAMKAWAMATNIEQKIAGT